MAASWTFASLSCLVSIVESSLQLDNSAEKLEVPSSCDLSAGAAPKMLGVNELGSETS